MKLELKHLAAYLPYDLKYQLYGNFPIKEGVENIVEDIRVIDLKNIQKVLDWATCKPILRPLSDLNKEITHGEKTFNPKFVIDMAFPGERMGLNPATWSHRVITKLQEWHFDVFGLIENGLAIDINTLKL